MEIIGAILLFVFLVALPLIWCTGLFCRFCRDLAQVDRQYRADLAKLEQERVVLASRYQTLDNDTG
jgi:cell division protein FtsB